MVINYTTTVPSLNCQSSCCSESRMKERNDGMNDSIEWLGRITAFYTCPRGQRDRRDTPLRFDPFVDGDVINHQLIINYKNWSLILFLHNTPPWSISSSCSLVILIYCLIVWKNSSRNPVGKIWEETYLCMDMSLEKLLKTLLKK